VLSTSASIFQHWLSRTDHSAARDPYFLYSASNLGCLLALASYPTIVEPMLTLRQQTRLWAIGYAGFALLAGACAFVVWRRRAASGAAPLPSTATHADAASTPVSGWRRMRWVTLAFIPSSLMLAVTSYVSTDIAAVPLLWIVPLGLYLLTFAVAFGAHGGRARQLTRLAVPLIVVPLALVMIAKVQVPLLVVVSLHLTAFAVMALNCHGDLAHDRPDVSHLTEFYFWVAFGGMLGGLFNTLAAPVLFNSIIEYPLVVLVACLLFRASDAPPVPRSMWRVALVPLVVFALTAAILLVLRSGGASLPMQLCALSIPALLAFSERRQAQFGWCMAALIVPSAAFGNADERVLHATRTFFGVYRVSEDRTSAYHGLAHGTTLHGMQALAPGRRTEALTYFHETGPFGQAWKTLPLAAGPRIAVVGLGVGTLATYARPGQRWTFFEIDPAIETIARTPAFFSFMDGCAERCDVVLGDARVSLGRVPEHSYSVLVLDAFSSDSIPMHLMTREAVALYLSRLVPGGVLVMHISNRHLQLAPVVAALAANEGLAALQQVERKGDAVWPEGKSESHWIVMSREAASLGGLGSDGRWSPLRASAAQPLWTDDFSNILSVLSVR
jgi:hypothetical protein